MFFVQALFLLQSFLVFAHSESPNNPSDFDDSIRKMEGEELAKICRLAPLLYFPQHIGSLQPKGVEYGFLASINDYEAQSILTAVFSHRVKNEPVCENTLLDEVLPRALHFLSMVPKRQHFTHTSFHSFCEHITKYLSESIRQSIASQKQVSRLFCISLLGQLLGALEKNQAKEAGYLDHFAKTAVISLLTSHKFSSTQILDIHAILPTLIESITTAHYQIQIQRSMQDALGGLTQGSSESIESKSPLSREQKSVYFQLPRNVKDVDVKVFVIRGKFVSN